MIDINLKVICIWWSFENLNFLIISDVLILSLSSFWNSSDVSHTNLTPMVGLTNLKANLKYSHHLLKSACRPQTIPSYLSNVTPLPMRTRGSTPWGAPLYLTSMNMGGSSDPLATLRKAPIFLSAAHFLELIKQRDYSRNQWIKGIV